MDETLQKNSFMKEESERATSNIDQNSWEFRSKLALCLWPSNLKR